MVTVKTPLIPFLSEFYTMLTNADEVDFGIYDSGTDIKEILGQLRNIETVQFGIIGNVTCQPIESKTENSHRVSVTVELFSTYRGRLKIGEMINTLSQVVTKYEEVFRQNFYSTGFSLVNIDVVETSLGNSYNDSGIVWQNGSIRINYYISQL